MDRKDYFNQYATLESAIKALSRRIGYYEKHPLASSHGVVQSSMKSYPYCETHVVISGSDLKPDAERTKKVNDIYYLLLENRKKMEDLKLDIELSIQDIQNIEDRTIMQLKFIDGCTDAQIGEELQYDRSVISRKIRKIIDEM